MVNTEIRLIIFLQPKMEELYTVSMLRHREFKIFPLGHQLLGDRVRTETQVVNQ